MTLSGEEEQLEAQKARLLADARVIGDKIKARGAGTTCPFCGNTNWFVLDYGGHSTALKFLETPHSLPVYTLSCVKCGYIRQHLRQIVDGEVGDESEYGEFSP